MDLEGSKLLEEVLPEDYLKLTGGVIVRSLSELVEALGKLSDEEFGLYVYGEHNDFAEWILEAYWDDELTGKILGIRDRKKMVRFLKRVLKRAERESVLRIEAPKSKKNILGILRGVGI